MLQFEVWEPDISPSLQESPNKNYTIVWSDCVLISNVYNKNVNFNLYSTFTSRKSSLRAFIWYIYIHLIKKLTYALLILTPQIVLRWVSEG